MKRWIPFYIFLMVLTLLAGTYGCKNVEEASGLGILIDDAPLLDPEHPLYRQDLDLRIEAAVKLALASQEHIEQVREEVREIVLNHGAIAIDAANRAVERAHDDHKAAVRALARLMAARWDTDAWAEGFIQLKREHKVREADMAVLGLEAKWEGIAAHWKDAEAAHEYLMAAAKEIRDLAEAEDDLFLSEYFSAATAADEKWEKGLETFNDALNAYNIAIYGEDALQVKLKWDDETEDKQLVSIETQEALPYYSQYDKLWLYELQDGKCVACKVSFPLRNLEKDHILSLDKGGTDDIENLQLLCSACNRVKGNRGMEYLRAKLAE